MGTPCSRLYAVVQLELTADGLPTDLAGGVAGRKGMNSAGKDGRAAAGPTFSYGCAQRGAVRAVGSLRSEGTSEVTVSNHRHGSGGDGWNRGARWGSGRALSGSAATLSGGPSAAERTAALRDTWGTGGDAE